MSTLPIGGRRWTASSSSHADESHQSHEVEEPTSNDFLTVLTHATSLYSQPGTHDMQMVDISKKHTQLIYGQGAVGLISAANADVALPNTLYSARVDNRTVECVVKEYPDGLWDAHGKVLNASEASCFMTELRVLSNPVIRNSGNIVKILGLVWAPEKETGISKPGIMLERANLSLSDLLERGPERPPLDLNTRLRLALDIAHGIWMLHSCGIVHGDIKPANVLIFESQGSYRAKLADFSHAAYPPAGTDPFQYLTGGTRIYAAPEWEDPAVASRLKLTDVYSYGLVFACLMTGMEIFSRADEAQVSRQKRNGTLLQDLQQLIVSLSDPSLTALPALCRILALTVQPAPGGRDLAKVIEIISKEAGLPLIYPVTGNTDDGEPEEVASTSSFRTSQLSIPYQSLSSMPHSFQRHIVRALKHLSNEDADVRKAAAAFELGVCYSSGFGVQHRNKFDDGRLQHSSMQWLLLAAKLGDDRARLALIPTFEAFSGHLPEDVPIKTWLKDLFEDHGDSLALEQLKHIDPTLRQEALKAYQARHYAATSPALLGQSFDSDRDPLTPMNSNGDTILHYLASTGNLEDIQKLEAENPTIFAELLNRVNSLGDTAIIQATKAGHAQVVVALVDAGGDAGVCNLRRETALHHLVNLDSDEVREVVFKLARAGGLSRLHEVASGGHILNMDSPGPGTAAMKAIYRDNPSALRALFDVEAELEPEQQSGKAELLSLLETAVRFHSRKVLPILEELMGLEMETVINSRQFLQNGQFRTLLEICALGPVSPIPASGINYPERFIRILRSGLHYRDGLGACIEFLLRHGASVSESGIVSFLFKRGRRDAVFHLALHTANSLSWARLSITSNQLDLFNDILQASLESGQGTSGGASRVNYPLLFASMMLESRLDAMFLQLLLSWIKRACGSNRLRWVPSGHVELRKLQRLANLSGPITEFMPLYIAASQKRLDWVQALLSLGASLQDATSSGETVLRLLLSNVSISPRDLTVIFKDCIHYRSKKIITFADIACLLDAPCCEGGCSHIYRLKDRKGGRASILGPIKDDSSGLGLVSYKSLSEIRTLWAFIAKANDCQRRPLKFPGGDNNGLPNLVLFAAMRSNWVAVRFLLDIGFPADGTGLLFKESDLQDLSITPLDVVQWTSHVSESCCGQVPRELQASNREIANLLLRHGASHSRTFGSIYHLLLQPFVHLLVLAWSGILQLVRSSIGEVAVCLGLFLAVLGFWVGEVKFYLWFRNLSKVYFWGFIVVIVDVMQALPIVYYLTMLFVFSPVPNIFLCVYGRSLEATVGIVYQCWWQSALGLLRLSRANTPLPEADSLLESGNGEQFEREYRGIVSVSE
ncbi:hypothetical protein FALCPG4_018307 [Fusarium falciforme]